MVSRLDPRPQNIISNELERTEESLYGFFLWGQNGAELVVVANWPARGLSAAGGSPCSEISSMALVLAILELVHYFWIAGRAPAEEERVVCLERVAGLAAVPSRSHRPRPKP